MLSIMFFTLTLLIFRPTFLLGETPVHGINALYLDDLYIRVENGALMSLGKDSITIRSLGPETDIYLFKTDPLSERYIKFAVNNVNVESLDLQRLESQLLIGKGINDVSFEIDLRTLEEKIISISKSGKKISRFSFIVLGENRGNYENLSQIISDINQRRPLFVANLGDFLLNGEAKDYRVFFNYLKGLYIPYYSLMGPVERAGGGEPLYSKYFGPSNYSFHWGAYHFIFLDNSLGFFTRDVFAWFENELKTNSKSLIFIFTHLPILKKNGDYSRYINRAHSDLFRRSIKPYRVLGVFSTHINDFYTVTRDNIKYFMFSSRKESLLEAAPRDQYLIVDVNDLSVDVKSMQLFMADKTLKERVYLITKGFINRYRLQIWGGVIFLVVVFITVSVSKKRRKGRGKIKMGGL